MKTQNGNVRLPLLPCLCMGLATLLFGVTLLNSKLPISDDHSTSFVSAQGSPRRVPRTPMQVRKKWTIADRGTPEYEAYMRGEKEKKEEEWELFTARDGVQGMNEKRPANFGLGTSVAEEETWKNGGLGEAPAPAAQQGGGFSFPSFGGSAPAPAPSPAAVNPGKAGDSGGNPFQFIIDIFQPTTTTTTTTTPPPDPITAFFNSLR